MPLSRRAFVRSVGLGSAGAFALPMVAGRGFEAAESERRYGASLGAPGSLIRLSSNENPNGPGKEAMAALEATLSDASRYPTDPAAALVDAIAAAHRVTADNVLLGCGSTELLRVAVEAFVTPGAGLVTGGPSFESPVNRCVERGLPVTTVPVDSELRLDLGGMIDRASGAGLVYLCNPNNPTATVHGAAAVTDFVGRVLAKSPRGAVLIDEAYFEYVDDPGYATAIPLALEDPRVVVFRTFSKVHGMAGLRVGYAIARPETIKAMKPYRLELSVNILAAVAARASLGALGHLEQEREKNRKARSFTRDFFARAGYPTCPSETNFVMVDVRRPIEAFRKACADRGVGIGRPFPPLLNHARISIGTMAEMEKAVRVFGEVLAG